VLFRSILARSVSSRQLGHIKEGLVDFVYLDADHDYESVQDGILRWWPLISGRGILAGHDFDDTHPGVQRAVKEFAETSGLTVYVTQEHPNSWYCYKSGIPGPKWQRTSA
jgi:hypothetical protein